jgi:DNA-binding response OmpR family regulator
MRVLLVEDDPGIQMLLKRFLDRQGFVVDVANEGEAALRIVKSTRYDVVLLDLMMPHVNGFEFIRELKSSAPHLLNRTIVLTAASEATLRDFDQQQVFSLIRKPFDLSHLATTLSSCAALPA